MSEVQSLDLESAVAAIEAAKEANQPPDHLQERVMSLGVTIGTGRKDIKETLTTEPAAPEAPVASQAPAFIKTPQLEKAFNFIKLDEQIEAIRDTQKKFQLLHPGEIPLDPIKYLATFTPEMLAKARNFQNPTLTRTTKGRSFNDLVAAMDGYKTTPDQNDAYVNDLYRAHASQKSEHWGAYFIEGPTEMKIHDFDDKNSILSKRLAEFSKQKKELGLTGMDRWKYAHLMMQNIKDGKPIDVINWTMLDEDPALSASRVPGAGFDPRGRRVGFDDGGPQYPYDNGRLRFSVGGDVK